MKTLKITGGNRLFGEITVSGSKNAALPILFASLLIEDEVFLDRVPMIRDTDLAADLLSALSVRVQRGGSGSWHIDARGAAPTQGELLQSRLMRGSVYLLGASLGRFGEARLPLPGGCDFGARPIDCHLAVLREMGAEIREENGVLLAKAPRLNGAFFHFPFVSVGATVNAILAGVCATGRTVLTGAAEEPHVIDLIAFLRAAGADISIPDPGVILINGGKRLHGCRHRITSDMIEAGTFLFAVAAAGGEACLRGADAAQLGAVTELLRQVGATVGVGQSGITVCRDGRLLPAVLRTSPYPGFPTDLQPQAVALLARATGESRVTETVWARRFRYVEELLSMGADLTVSGRDVICRGVQRLSGARVTVPDLRAGAALAIAALSADGESVLENASLIDRGYERFSDKLRALGAAVSADGGA